MLFLVADPSKGMRHVTKTRLVQAGYGGHRVVEAADGAEALELVRQKEPQFVLAEWDMPKMGGPALLATLRSERPRLRFGFISSDVSPDRRARAYDMGAFILQKPVMVWALRHALIQASRV